ncbi:DUF4386 domain-containing protein [Hyphobacterium sp. CCMP332]|nr:DUF4386 domain-containing protein [Hyphobacterium sp. CCMP332]
MMSIRKTAIIAGILWIVQLLTASISYSVILDPILWGGNFLADISVNQSSAKTAMFLDLFCGASVLGIAVILYPIFKKYSERIAIWYVGLRVIEFGTIIIQGILLLSLISVSHEFVQATTPQSSYLEILGKTIRQQRDWTQNMTIISFCLGAFMLYYLFFKTKLVPRFISIWGLIAVLLLFTQMILLTFGDTLRMVLMIPMGLNELFLGFWLIFKGFNSHVTYNK